MSILLIILGFFCDTNWTCQIVLFQMANQIDMNAQSELMASFEENL